MGIIYIDTKKLKIWRKQYERYCSNDEAYPDRWIKSTSEIDGFLKSKVVNKAAIVVITME